MNAMKSLLLLTLLISCTQKQVSEADKKLLEQAQTHFSPLPQSAIDKIANADLIALGMRLYNEPKLSASGTISCNSCHRLDNYGVDSEPTSPGHDGTRGGRNSPTTFNAAFHSMQFWDGRAATLEEQALGPVLNPIEHGLSDEKQVVEILIKNDYLKDFQAAFKGEKSPVTFQNFGKAVAAFEKTLVTPTRFDEYLNGNVHALDDFEKAGLRKFMEVGCIQCHSGTSLGGDSFQKLGQVKPYPSKDLGLYDLTKKSRDKFKFKVPGLRNVTMTAPYFHDGSVVTLDKAIEIMAEYQLGKTLSHDDVKDIKAFLSTLTAKKMPF